MRKGFLCNKKGFSPPATEKEGDGKGPRSSGKRSAEGPRTIIDVVEDGEDTYGRPSTNLSR